MRHLTCPLSLPDNTQLIRQYQWLDQADLDLTSCTFTVRLALFGPPWQLLCHALQQAENEIIDDSFHKRLPALLLGQAHQRSLAQTEWQVNVVVGVVRLNPGEASPYMHR